MANENVVKKESQEWTTTLDKASNTYIQSVVSNCAHQGVEVSPYAKQCMKNACIQIAQVLQDNSWRADAPKTFNDLDQQSIVASLNQISATELNPYSFPMECAIVLKGKQIQFMPVGEGNVKMTAKFGQNIKTMHEAWLVREDDDFTYPHYKGVKIEPPEWTPKGKGKVVRVVYPIELTNGGEEYLIAEREEVKTNLLAAINQNYDTKVNGKQDKSLIEAKKKLIERLKNLDIEDILNDSEVLEKGKLSPAWLGANSEQMIIRKMKNNAVRNYPKDYSNSYAKQALIDMEKQQFDGNDITAYADVVEQPIEKKQITNKDEFAKSKSDKVETTESTQETFPF